MSRAEAPSNKAFEFRTEFTSQPLFELVFGISLTLFIPICALQSSRKSDRLQHPSVAKDRTDDSSSVQA